MKKIKKYYFYPDFLFKSALYHIGRIIILINLRSLSRIHTNYKKSNKQDFQKHRVKRLVKTLKYAYKHSHYYADLFKKTDLDLHSKNIEREYLKVPLLTKDTLRLNLTNILTMKLDEYVGQVTTGGSSGTPLGFYRFGGYDVEHQLFLYKLMGYKKNSDKIIWMGGTELPKEDVENFIYWKRHNARYFSYYSLSSQYLNQKNFIHYVNFFINYQPTIIRGYPSFIYLFCEYLKTNNITISYKIKGVELTSEMAYDYQIAFIREVLDCNVYLQYGHAEGSVFGYSLANQNEIYCSPFYGYVEILDENGDHVNPGGIGEVVVTGFDNMAMQFIRYKTNDLAEYKQTVNGIVILNKIYGRTQDFIYDFDRNKILITAIIYGMHYNAFKNIKKLQLIQEEYGKVTAVIVRNHTYNQEDEEELRTKFHDVAKIELSFDYVDDIRSTTRGKHLFLIQKLTE